jgi:hypothetical protein
MNAIKVTGLRKSFEKLVLDGVDLRAAFERDPVR